MNNDEAGRSQTIREFCASEHLSLSSFYELVKRDLAPELLEIPGTKIKRITRLAQAAWHKRMAELAKSEGARLESDRRRAQAVKAGQLAAASPLHVSKLGSARRLSARRRRG
jgi:hypothetical protein